MMRIIRYSLLSLVCSFSLFAKADTNNYTFVLHQIQASVDSIDDVVWDTFDLYNEIGSIIDDMSMAIKGGRLPDDTYWTNLGNAIAQMRNKINDIDGNVSFIEEYSRYIQDIFNNTVSIDNYLYNDLATYLSQMQQSLFSLDSFGASLEAIVQAVNNAAATAEDISSNQAYLNREETQQDILDALEDIRGRLTVFPEEDIHTLVSIGNNIQSLLSEALRLMTQWKDLFNFWDQFYFRQFNGLGYLTFDYYRILGSPEFDMGYNPQLQSDTYEGWTFVESLFSLLRGHLNLLSSINDGILFLGKNIASNGQSQVENDFQEQKDDVVASLDSGYQQLRAYTYSGISYNLRDTKLYDVSTFISSFESSQYDAVKVHNLDISSFEVFGDLPTYFDFQYDLTPIASYLELVRNVFTVFWVLFFASFWIFLVSLFYRFYHFLYRLLCMVPGQSAPPPGPGLPAPSGGAVMA